MTQEQAALQAVSQVIEKMSLADRLRVALAVIKLRELIERHGDHGRIALAVVGAEEAAK